MSHKALPCGQKILRGVVSYTSSKTEREEGKEYNAKIFASGDDWWKVGDSYEDVLNRLDQIPGVTLIRTTVPSKEVSDKEEISHEI